MLRLAYQLQSIRQIKADKDIGIRKLYILVQVAQKQYNGAAECPENFEEMIYVAETLAKGIEFIRVDLYSTAGRIYFGELTNYPEAGTGRFTPRSYDYNFGEKWKTKL